MATLSEHAEKITAAIEAAESDGFTVETTTCCCGDGLRILDSERENSEFIL